MVEEFASIKLDQMRKTEKRPVEPAEVEEKEKDCLSWRRKTSHSSFNLHSAYSDATEQGKMPLEMAFCTAIQQCLRQGLRRDLDSSTVTTLRPPTHFLASVPMSKIRIIREL